MAKTLEFWFDFSCPYSYLAWTQLEGLAARTGARLRLEPFSLSSLFDALDVKGRLFSPIVSKSEHGVRDLERHGRWFGVDLRIPDQHSMDTGAALRALMSIEQDKRATLVDRFYRASWVEGRDISDAEVIRSILQAEGVDADEVLSRAQGEGAMEALRRRTQAGLEKGLFGAPTFLIEDELFWGVDRLYMVESKLLGRPISPLPSRLPAELRPIDVWFDYSSPFAYLGVNRAYASLGSSLRLCPMLLGAVFKAIGQHNVPMMTFSDSKRRNLLIDIHRQADEIGVPFSFPSHFPMNSVKALRLTLAASEGGRVPWPLVYRILLAFWGEGQDISNPDLLTELANEVGLDGPGLMARSQAEAVKQALFSATSTALSQGVFGAPTYVVHREAGAKSVFWGADRFHLALRAASGVTAVY